MRSILTTVTDSTNEYLLRQNLNHCTRTRKILSAAKVARALLTACAVADVQLAEQDDEEAITAFVVDIFRHAARISQA